jgi:alpha-galactosidase
MHATFETPHLARQWTEAHFSAAGGPFSFRYGGRAAAELLPAWTFHAETARDGAVERRTLTWRDPKTGLVARCEVVVYHDFPVVEWTLSLRNDFTADSPLLEAVQGMDVRFPVAQGDDAVLHHHKGDFCVADGYEPLVTRLAIGMTVEFAPQGGRGSNVSFPYYRMQFPTGGVTLAVGWPGQWQSRFARDFSQVTVGAGQQQVHCTLHPGEELRAPCMALLFWEGRDLAVAHNQWRRWMFAHVLPRPGGRLPAPALGMARGEGGFEWVHQTTQTQLGALREYFEHGIQPDYFWIDAGWYPCGEHWQRTGTWEVDAARFPRGLREISDAAHARGVKLLVWFEPERILAGVGADLERDHRNWLLYAPEDPTNALLDLGNPEALAWLTEHVGNMLAEQGIDVYRQDFNFEPLPFWRAHDAANRQGMAENQHVSGYLAYWDALRARFPDLLIDSCASGGRRNDLETMRRSVPLHKTDYNYADQAAKQCFHYVLYQWLPYFAASAYPYEVDPYVFRSAMAPWLNLGFHLNADGVDVALLRRLVAEWRAIGPYLLGDYYPLTPYSRAEDHWLAWQFHRPEMGDGIVQAFRRADCEKATQLLALRAVDPAAKYRVRDLETDTTVEWPGEELATCGLPVTVPSQPGASLLLYGRI